MTQGDYDKVMLEDFAFAVVALRLRPEDYWSMSRAEYMACVKMWKRLNGVDDPAGKTQESVDSFSKYISGTFGGQTETK
jgi:hypothetical protein